METTTIAITKNVRDSLAEFGNKGETFTEVISRLVKSARERQLNDLLMDEEDTISIDEALSNSKKRWQE